MTAAQWGTLVPVLAAVGLSAAAWLRAQAAHKKIDNHARTPPPAGSAAQAARSVKACRAAIPVPVHNYTGRMLGDSPVIVTGTESVHLAWAECGQPAAAVHLYRCGCGHEKTAATCGEDAPRPGQVGCRACLDQGHDCEMRHSVAVAEPQDEHSLDLRE